MLLVSMLLIVQQLRGEYHDTLYCMNKVQASQCQQITPLSFLDSHDLQWILISC
jgi:hypothetical protein